MVEEFLTPGLANIEGKGLRGYTIYIYKWFQKQISLHHAMPACLDVRQSNVDLISVLLLFYDRYELIVLGYLSVY